MEHTNKKTYYYFYTPSHLKNFLKEELKKFRPQWKFSYSKGALLTYVEEGENTLNYQPVFAFQGGVVHWKSTSREECEQFIFKQSDKDPKIKWGIFSMDDQLQTYIVGTVKFRVKSFQHDTWNENQSNEVLDKSIPSRAYYKIQQIHEELNLFHHGEVAMEFGSAPGGASHFLLQKGLKVIGVDSGDMNPVCLNHPNFIQLKKGIQKITAIDLKEIAKLEELKNDVDWIVSDMNLPPFIALKEIRQFIFTHKKFPRKGLVLTLKMTKIDMVNHLNDIELKIQQLKNYRIHFMGILPGHHQEFALVALRQ